MNCQSHGKCLPWVQERLLIFLDLLLLIFILLLDIVRILRDRLVKAWVIHLRFGVSALRELSRLCFQNVVEFH